MARTDWPTIITAIVALYGAVLSTINALSKRREKMRRVKAELKWGIIPNMSGTSPPMFFLSASNPGSQTVTLTGCGIILPNKKQLVPIQAEGEVRLPYSLEGGKSCTFWMSIPEVVDAMRRFGGGSRIHL